jgi:subfamily B ATP-binding cassette protein HlyB/CyaB
LKAFPEQLNSDCVNQLDQTMSRLGVDTQLAIILLPKEHGLKISSSLIFEHLAQIDSIRTQWVEWKSLKGDFTECPHLCFSTNGMNHLIEKAENSKYLLKRYLKIDDVIESIWVTASEMIESGILPQALNITKKQPQSALSQPLLPPPSKMADDDSAAVQEHYVMRHFRRQSRTALSIIGVSVVIALLGVITPLGFQTFTDKILPYQAQSSLMVIAILLVVAAFMTAMFNYYHDYQESVLFAKYQSGLGKEVFNRLLAMEVPYFDARNVGELTKLVDQVEEASNFLVRQLLGSVVALISLLVVLPILFMYDVDLTLIVLGIGVLMAVTIGLSLRPLRRRVMAAYGYDAGFQSTLIETLKGMKTIKALANESFFRQRANHALEVNLFGGFNVAKLSNLVRAIVSFQSQLITICVIFFGAQAVFAQTMTIGQLIAFNMLANNVVNPLVALVFTASGYETFRLAKKKLSELEPPNDPVMPLADDQLNLVGNIVFKDVWFKYPNTEDYVLKGINLTIKQGDIVGIVGGSGSGKSTLAALIMGFYAPNKGSVQINGYDLALLPKKQLRSRIASVQQTSFLFHTSVLQNIHLGRLNAGVEDIQQSLADSGSDEFVDAMPQKFMTHLSEDGDNLSGGQRQRLAIARALVRNADILLFDEATSALDNQTEDTIKHTIHQACQDKTGIIIAHRLNTLTYCNQLVVMTNGEIEAQGSHEELIEGDNSYKAMYESMVKR